MLLLTGCTALTPKQSSQLTQISTIDGLMVGVYDGFYTVGDLKRHGNLGIGTVDKLDGELILLNGKVMHVRADGRAYMLDDKTLIPFASVVDFAPDKQDKVNEKLSYSQFVERMVKFAPNPNVIVALHCRGRFKFVHTRSVPAQQRPYRPLTEITKNQPEFQLENITGDLVGFRLPAYVKGINVPGWHLHFIADDQLSGGHVMDFELLDGDIEIDEIYDFRMILPQNSLDFNHADLATDRSDELKKVEGKR
ncbi:MAG: acetolactate decarboxylase [Lentisphaeria bacterium]|nr:acetolactate decarboxylase [Lentisphaeria bacterium]